MKRNIHKIYLTIGLLLGFLTTCIDDANVDVGIVTNASLPTLSEVSIVDSTATTVTVEGEIVAYKGYPVTERGIVWGTGVPLDIERDSHRSMPDNNSGSILLTAEDLKGATTYYFGLYAKNREGTGYGPAKSITTNSGLGSVETFIIHANTRATTALAGGLILSRGEGDIEERGVYYFQSGDMANKDSIISTSPIEKDSFVCNLSGLDPSVKYFVQAYVKNSFGIFMGDSLDFTTGSGKPELKLELSVTPFANRAQVVAEITSIGEDDLIQRGFYWSKTANPPTESDNVITVAITVNQGLGEMKAEIQPLDANQQYYVIAFARNAFGTSYSSAQPFTTSSAKPTVITLTPTSFDNGAVVFGGSVTNVGASNVTRIGVCYSTSNPSPTTADNCEDVPISPVSEDDVPYSYYAGPITGLRGATTYYVCAFAENGSGIVYGTPQILNTPPIFTQESESFTGETTRIEGSSAYFMIGDKGYLLGGDIGTSYISTLYSYIPALNYADRWGKLNSYEGGEMKSQSVAVHSTNAYALGGMGNGAVVKNDFYVYNSMGNLWFQRATGPDSAYSRAGFSLNNEVFYVGGMRDTANNEVWAYNVDLNVWSQKPDFPVKQYGGIAVTISGNAYVGLGKNTAGDGNKQLWKSSGGVTSWTPEPAGTDLSGNILAGVVFNSKIYVIDKSPPPMNRYYIFEYDPAMQVWKRKSELPYYGWWNIQCMYSIGDRIYIGFVNNVKVVSYNPLWDN